MDNINDLVGDAAKQLMAQADGIQNPRLKESAKRVALTVSAKTRDETITKARNAAFARIPIWAFFLPVTRRQQIVLGRIYSFQCTTNKDGIGSVTYWVAVVERAMEDAVMGWLPCDRDGVTEDEEGMVPDDATVAYISTLDGSREERAFELAKHDYYGFLDYKEDRYTTVYGYMD